MHREHAFLFPLPFTPISGTYPAGLETPPSRTDALDADIVILEPKDEPAARQEGFNAPTPVRGLYLARRE
jgi:hypothetical protein